MTNRAGLKSLVGKRIIQSPEIGIALLYAIFLFVVSPIHAVFDEWGGTMQYFAGKELLNGAGYQGWASHFWPPLFSILVGLGSKIMPGFLAGKLISILSSSVLLYIAYRIAVELTGDKRVGLLTQVFVGLSPVYFAESVNAHNHMLDALILMTSLWSFIVFSGDPKPATMILSGVIGGLAGLTRFTSYVLLALPLFLFLDLSGFGLRRVVKSVIAFWLGYGLISLPLWVFNVLNYGFPLYNWEHLNICTAVVPGNSPGSFYSLWWCSGQENLDSLFSIFKAFPSEYLRNFLHNLFDSTRLLLKYGGVLEPIVVPGFLEGFLFLKQKKWLVFMGMLALYVLLDSQAFINPWFLLSWTVVVITVSVLFALKFIGLLLETYPLLRKLQFQKLCLAALVVIGLVSPLKDLNSIRLENNTRNALADENQVTQTLVGYDPDLSQKVIMAIDPAWAYYTGSKFLNTPLNYGGTLDGLVSYRGVGDRERVYAPKYPSNLQELKADYLIYTKNIDPPVEPDEDPRFSFLLDPTSPQIPGYFKLVYSSDKIVVYEINWDLAADDIQ